MTTSLNTEHQNDGAKSGIKEIERQKIGAAVINEDGQKQVYIHGSKGNVNSNDGIITEADSKAAAPTHCKTHQEEKKKREICRRCSRPKPRACICESLPASQIPLHKTSVVVLQHPLELKHKNNRSIPILELCLQPDHIHLCVGRRLGDQIDPNIMNLLQPPNIPLLLYPADQGKKSTRGQTKVCSLMKAMEHVREQQQKKGETPSGGDSKEHEAGRIVLLALDATWNYAREMNQANMQTGQYPPQLIQVSLEEQDFPNSFQPRRFDTVRTVPNSDKKNKNKNPKTVNREDRNTEAATKAWMCTAECIAYALSRIEGNPDIYDTVIKPIDIMVAKWNSFVQQPKIRQSKTEENQQQQEQQRQSTDEEDHQRSPVTKKQKT